MNIGAVVAGSVLLVVMAGVVVYAAVTLPRDARLPVHFGVGGYSNWLPKRAAVAVWTGVAVLIYAIILVTAGSAHQSRSVGPDVILPVAQFLLILNHLGAIKAARSRGLGG